MFRSIARPRRTALVGALLVMTTALSACGDSADSGDESYGGLDQVSVSGDFNKAPEVKWDGQVGPEDRETDVVIEGDGDEIAKGDQVMAQLWFGNGYEKKEAYNSFKGGTPELIDTDSKDMLPILGEIVDGERVGSRIAVATTADDVFGDAGNPQLGIGNRDGIVLILDIVSKVLPGPQGEDKDPAKWAPALKVDGDSVTGFDFGDGRKPSKNLLDTYVVKGDGPLVKKGQTIAVNYLGQVNGAKKSFDESYSKGAPTSFGIGVGQVVSGWDKELVGKPVGSRVILSIPPKEGYGDTGNEQAGIKGTDTLFFVVDILGAA